MAKRNKGIEQRLEKLEHHYSDPSDDDVIHEEMRRGEAEAQRLIAEMRLKYPELMRDRSTIPRVVPNRASAATGILRRIKGGS
jgi:hypothetical protein